MFGELSNFREFIMSFFEIKKDSILEPLTCLVRLSIIDFKPLGTKISLNNNRIKYNDPNMLQGALRWSNGDNREDLHNLYNPFIKSFEWFPNDNEKHTFFYNLCKSGLEKLINSYDKDSIVCHTLQHYTKMFDDILNNREVQKLNELKESPLLEEFKTFWKNEELEIIYKILKFIDHSDKIDEKNNYINIIEGIVKTKEKLVQDYINKYSTSYN